MNKELAETGRMLPPNTVAYNIEGPFFFGVIEKMEHAFAVTNSDPERIIFRLRYVPFMDMTGLQTLCEVIQHFHVRGVKVFLCESNQGVIKKLTKVNVDRLIAGHKIFDSLSEVVDSLSKPENERND